jgi:hypothetical protein
MKHPRITLCCVLLLLAGSRSNADTSFTSTAWLIAVPLPGITTTNSSGQVSLKENVHVVRILSTNINVTGRLQASMDLAYQPDGTAPFSGPAYCEVGIWAGTNFTPSGGVWALNYSGVLQADGSARYSMAGYGIGGSIEGMRISLTATRAAPGTPDIPYLASGTIKPPPVQIKTVVDNFDNNRFDPATWWNIGAGSGTFHVGETNQQLTFGGKWTSPTVFIMDHTAYMSGYGSWSVAEGHTAEARADLVSLDPAAGASVNLALYHGPNQGYGLTKSPTWIGLWKQNGASTATFFCAKRVTASNTNVVLVFDLTPVGQNVILTGKVLDKSGMVIAQQSCVDTPASDAALSAAELATLAGAPRVWHDIGADLVGTPWKDGASVTLMVAQDTDGTLPPALATFDNVEFRSYEALQVSAQRAVTFSWPDTGQNYIIESAPTVNGPWQPVVIPAMPGMQSLTLPADKSMEIIRVH